MDLPPDPVPQSESKEETKAQQEEQIVAINVNVITTEGQTIPLQVTGADTVQDIRQYLLEANETVFLTSYHLEFNGKPLNDFLELESPDLKDGSSFYIVEDPYNEASARVNVNRLKELLKSQPACKSAESPAMLSEVAKGVHTQELIDVEGQGPQAGAQHYLSNLQPYGKCLKKLRYSGWNPVLGNRRLRGDLFYLDLETLEGDFFSITAWTNGFFVNSSKDGEFNPAPHPSGHRAHSLVTLLRQVSPKFTIEFAQLLSKKAESHPYETLPVLFAKTNWLRSQQTPQFDFDDAEAALTQAAEADFFIQGQYHDWNEELQSCREHTKATQQDRITRDRGLFRVYADFVEAATKGAIATVDGNVPPINPTEDKKVHMFIYNNIFFSFAVDSRDFFKDLGGDMAAYKSASHDLLGVKAYDQANVEKLYTLATAVIDYRGYRIVAQSIVPGLFSGLMQEESAVEIVYGTLDGKSIKADPVFHGVLSEAAKKLFIKPHSVVDSEGNVSEIASHADIKGIRGSDGRMYVLDLIRHCPRDANYPGIPTALLRPELIEIYVKVLREKEFTRLETEKGIKRSVNPSPEDQAKLTEIEEQVSKVGVWLNVDVLSQYQLSGPQPELEEDVNLVKSLSSFILEKQIPLLIERLGSNKVSLIDGQSLTAQFHQLGINMRYLGKVAKQISTSVHKHQSHDVVFQREMITRVFKHIFSDYIKKVKEYNLSTTIVELINTFFGRFTRGGKGSYSGVPSYTDNAEKPQKKEKEDKGEKKENTNQQQKEKNKKGKQPQKQVSGANVVSQEPQNRRLPQSVANEPIGLTHNSLWLLLRNKVEEKYDYTLPHELSSQLFTIPTLRAICQKVGVQLVAREYNFESESLLSKEDIVCLFPVVKHAAPTVTEGHELLTAGKQFLANGHLDVAFELISEAVSLFQEVYGLLHSDIANCTRLLAFILHQAGEFQQAVFYQQKSLIISERLYGVDHFDNASLYDELARFQDALAGKTSSNFCKRALYLNSLVAGPNNKDQLAYYLHLASILEKQGEKSETVHYYTKALELSERMYGRKNARKADLSHKLALLNQSIGKFKEALTFETATKELLAELYGEQDPRTLAATGSMLAFKNLLASGAQPPVEAAPVKEVNSIGNLPVSEIMQFFQDPNPRSVRRLGSHPSKAVGVRARNTNSGPTRVEAAAPAPAPAKNQQQQPVKQQEPQAQNTQAPAQGKKKRRRNKKK